MSVSHCDYRAVGHAALISYADILVGLAAELLHLVSQVVWCLPNNFGTKNNNVAEHIQMFHVVPPLLVLHWIIRRSTSPEGCSPIVLCRCAIWYQSCHGNCLHLQSVSTFFFSCFLCCGLVPSNETADDEMRSLADSFILYLSGIWKKKVCVCAFISHSLHWRSMSRTHSGLVCFFHVEEKFISINLFCPAFMFVLPSSPFFSVCVWERRAGMAAHLLIDPAGWSRQQNAWVSKPDDQGWVSVSCLAGLLGTDWILYSSASVRHRYQ